VGILLPQRPETALSHIAVYKMGAVALPLFTQFGPEALEHRLQHSAARAVVTDGENLPKIEAIRSFLPELRYVLSGRRKRRPHGLLGSARTGLLEFHRG